MQPWSKYMENQLVVFDLAGEQFGVSISSVESIIKMQYITSLPQSPVYIKGVINLRGKVLPVMDLHTRFGLPEKVTDRNSRIIVVSIAGTTIGMIVDVVSEVLTVSEHSVEPTPAIATTIDSTFIVGIAKLDQRLVILLDLGKVLSPDEQADEQADERMIDARN
jgi:purine-binding chemotaxis protein CheW